MFFVADKPFFVKLRQPKIRIWIGRQGSFYKNLEERAQYKINLKRKLNGKEKYEV